MNIIFILMGPQSKTGVSNPSTNVNKKYILFFVSGMSSRTMPKWGHWFWITALIVVGFAGKSPISQKNC